MSTELVVLQKKVSRVRKSAVKPEQRASAKRFHQLYRAALNRKKEELSMAFFRKMKRRFLAAMMISVLIFTSIVIGFVSFIE